MSASRNLVWTISLRNVYHQIDADHYQSIGKVPTGPLGKTGLIVPELKKYFVAVPPHGAAAAEVLIFAVQ